MKTRDCLINIIGISIVIPIYILAWSVIPYLEDMPLLNEFGKQEHTAFRPFVGQSVAWKWNILFAVLISVPLFYIHTKADTDKKNGIPASKASTTTAQYIGMPYGLIVGLYFPVADLTDVVINIVIPSIILTTFVYYANGGYRSALFLIAIFHISVCLTFSAIWTALYGFPLAVITAIPAIIALHVMVAWKHLRPVRQLV